jgi:transcription elongation factor GreA
MLWLASYLPEAVIRLEDALKGVELIDDEPFDFDAIEIGDLITLQSEEGETESYVLVDDGVGARARSDWVSVTSPLGAAVLGRAKGERVEVNSPKGPFGYAIVDFERASESAPVSGVATDGTLAGDLPSEAFLG